MSPKALSLTIGLIIAVALSGCQGFIFRMDIPQGNYLTQKEVDKLRINMTKEQVTFVLGTSILPDTFSDDTWYYVYKMRRGMTDNHASKNLILSFENDRLVKMSGDFEQSEEFTTPLSE